MPFFGVGRGTFVDASYARATRNSAWSCRRRDMRPADGEANEITMATEAAAHEAHEVHAEPNYIAIFIYLAVLTGVELLVYAMGFTMVLKVGLLVALALAKAMLVAFCYLMLRPDLSARAWTRSHHPEEQVGVHEGAESSAPAAPAPDASTPPQS
jgi:hypothetical protein